MAEEEVTVKKSTTINYPGNSQKARATPKADEEAPDKKLEKVISGEAVQRKKSLGRKIADTFTGDDMHSVGQYILFDVLIPAAKTAISDAVAQGVERFFFGDGRPRSSSSRPVTTGPRTPYNQYSGSNARPEPARTLSHRARSAHDFSEIIVPTRGEALDVLDRLTDLIRQYGVASVSELYELVGITGTFVDEKWGWNDLRDSGVRRVGGGYLLDLPRPEPIS